MRLLIIEAKIDGETISSWCRGRNVGVGGLIRTSSDVYLGVESGDVRAATRNELRRLDRHKVIQLRVAFPEAVITWRRA